MTNGHQPPLWTGQKALRDEFAIAALPSVIAKCASDSLASGEPIEDMFARKAYRIADAMMAASK